MATAVNPAIKETVYDPLNHTCLVKDLTVHGRAALTQQLQFTSVRFFATAAVSMFEFWLYKGGIPSMAYTALATSIGMGLAGTFALKLNRAAFFAATAAYGLGSALLLGQAVCKHCPYGHGSTYAHPRGSHAWHDEGIPQDGRPPSDGKPVTQKIH